MWFLTRGKSLTDSESVKAMDMLVNDENAGLAIISSNLDRASSEGKNPNEKAGRAHRERNMMRLKRRWTRRTRGVEWEGCKRPI